MKKIYFFLLGFLFLFFSCSQPTDDKSDDNGGNDPVLSILSPVDQTVVNVFDLSVSGTWNNMTPDRISVTFGAQDAVDAVLNGAGRSWSTDLSIDVDETVGEKSIIVEAWSETDQLLASSSVNVDFSAVKSDIYGSWNIDGNIIVITESSVVLNDSSMDIQQVDNEQNFLLAFGNLNGSDRYLKLSWNEPFTQYRHLIGDDADLTLSDAEYSYEPSAVPDLISENPFGPYRLILGASLLSGDTNGEAGDFSTLDIDSDTFTYSLYEEPGMTTDNNLFQIAGNTLSFSGTPDSSARHNYDIVVRVSDPEGNTTDFPQPVYVRDAVTGGDIAIAGTWNCQYGSSYQGSAVITNSSVKIHVDYADLSAEILSFDNAGKNGMLVWTYHPSTQYIYSYSLFKWEDNGDGTGSLVHQKLGRYHTKSEAESAGFTDTGDPNYNDWDLSE